jgi:hypothetical protein
MESGVALAVHGHPLHLDLEPIVAEGYKRHPGLPSCTLPPGCGHYSHNDVIGVTANVLSVYKTVQSKVLNAGRVYPLVKFA